MNAKPGLITNTPLANLSSSDFEKVRNIDPRYNSVIPRTNLSWDRFRRKIKPYRVTFENGVCEEVLTNSVKNAVAEARKKHNSRIIKITVERTPGECKDLKYGVAKLNRVGAQA